MRNNRSTGIMFAILGILGLLAAPRAGAQKSNLATGLQITDSTDGNALVDSMLGPGIHRVGSAVLIGASDANGAQQGFFDTIGPDIIGFKSGIVLTTGYASNVIGPNSLASYTKQWFTAGDPILEGISGKGAGSSHD